MIKCKNCDTWLVNLTLDTYVCGNHNCEIVGKNVIPSCKSCYWRSDDFTSVCVNDKSEYCCDFVSEDDSCEHWEKIE